MKTRILLATFFSTALLTTQASANWSGIQSATIQSFEATVGNNYDIRVHLKGLTTDACGAGTPGWSYVNSNEENYNGMLSHLMLARTASLKVTLYLQKDAKGYCHIGHMQY